MPKPSLLDLLLIPKVPVVAPSMDPRVRQMERRVNELAAMPPDVATKILIARRERAKERRTRRAARMAQQVTAGGWGKQ